MRKPNVLAAVAAVATALLTPLGALAEQWEDDDGHVWTYSVNDTSATVTGVTGAEYDMEIPATLGGKPVVAFGTVFYNNTKISEVVIPDSVTAIAAQAFDGCSQLQRVTVGSGVTSVGNYAFRNCALLQKIELPEATTTLGTGAFAYCVKLNTAKIPGVTSIPGTGYESGPGSQYFDGYGAFFGCEKLRTLQLGEKLTYIGRGAFYNCNELYDLDIPDSVTHIDNYAFADCDKLHNLTLGTGMVGVGYCAFYNDTQLETLVFRGTSVSYLAAQAFWNCQNLRELNLPNGLTWIGEYCFRNCDSIPSVTIPDSVTTCTNGAFAYCDGLRSVKIGSGLTHIAGTIYDSSSGSQYFDGYGVFFNCTALTNISFNSTLRSIGRGAFYGCSALPKIVIPDSVRTIDWYAFAACGLLKDVIIGNGVRLIAKGAFMGDTKLETLQFGTKVQTIQSQAFDGCTALKPFSLPDTVLTIGDYAFRNCKSITTLTLPDSVGAVGFGVFANCTGLSTVVIGDGLEEITGTPYDGGPGSQYFNGFGTFYCCTALQNVTIGSSVATIGRGAFYGCTALPSITIPACVSTIGRYAFADCTALTTLDIKNGGVTLIDSYAFSGDNALASANLGDRLVTIGALAFQNCSKLTGLILPSSLITLGDSCFVNCKSLTQIVIPDKVKDLNVGAFAYCTGLKHAKIGSSLLTISGSPYDSGPGSQYFNGYGAFYGCTGLTSVDLGTTVSVIGNGAFYGCASLITLTIPDSVTTIGNYAFGACTSLATAYLGAGIVTLGNYVFNGDTALHYVTFAGDEAPVNVGTSIFNGTEDRMTVYVESGSEGWRALHEGGLPDNGMWQGRRITYAPPPEGAGNPYDFYVYSSKATISRKDYYWSFMLTTNRYVHGKTVPQPVTTIRRGDPVYLSYAFNEYWRGEAFNVTNRFWLTGTREGTFDIGAAVSAHSSAEYFWKTNATPEVLQNLVAGDYTLTVQLNGDNRLQETDYSNNQTSITFSVIGSLRCTVAFNLNGADGTAPDARTVVEGDVVGELPGVTAPAGWTFLGWFTAETGGTEVTASTVVTSDVTCYALWLKPNCHGIVFAPGEEFAEQSIECQSVEVGKVAKLKPCVFAAPAGKRFAGWRRADTGRRYDDGVMVFNLAGPGAVVVMEAVWDRAGE